MAAKYPKSIQSLMAQRERRSNRHKRVSYERVFISVSVEERGAAGSQHSAVGRQS